MSTQRREQLSVPIDPDLRAAVERIAAREERTLAGQVRYWIMIGLDHEREQAA